MMADDNGQQGQDGGQQAQDKPPVTPPQGDSQQPGPVPYDRFKQVNDRLKDLEAKESQRETDAKTAADKQLAEQQKWQTLAEQRETELAQEKAINLRQRIAMQKGIPADLIDRLSGETEEEIAADADKLLAFLKPATGPGVPPASKGGQPTSLDIGKMSMEEIRKNSAALTKQAFG